MKHLLQDVEHAFYLKDGPSLKNLHELERELRRMNDEQFQHHVNSSKNDFHSWIMHTVKDEELARSLAAITDKKEMAKTVKERIRQLEQPKTTKIAMPAKPKKPAKIPRVKRAKKSDWLKKIMEEDPTPPLTMEEVQRHIKSKIIEPEVVASALPEPDIPTVSVPRVDVKQDLARNLIPYALGIMAGVLIGIMVIRMVI